VRNLRNIVLETKYAYGVECCHINLDQLRAFKVAHKLLFIAYFILWDNCDFTKLDLREELWIVFLLKQSQLYFVFEFM